MSKKRKIAQIYERESRTDEVGRGNSCCPPFAHWYPIVDLAFPDWTYHERDGTVSTTFTPDRARYLCQYTYSHLAGMDPGYVWDLDVGLMEPEYRAQSLTSATRRLSTTT